MDCREVADRMAPWADRQLSPGEEELFEQHLRRCGACKALAGRIAAQDVRPPKILPLRPGMWTRMDGALAAELDRMDDLPAAQPAPPRLLLQRRLVVPVPALLLYAALLLLAVGWGLRTHQQLQESRAQTVALRLEQEREKRLAVQPASPQPQVYRLTKTAPTRGMF